MVPRLRQHHGRHGHTRSTSPNAGPRPRPDASYWLYGRHPVAAALANPQRRWYRLAVLAGQEAEARALAAAATAACHGPGNEAVCVFDRGGLAAMLPPGAVHQGLAVEVEPLAPPALDDVLEATEATPGRTILVALDRVGDPHNVGAVLRSAAAFGAIAVLLPAHGAPSASGVLGKAASGALERVPLVRVVNLARALDRAKEAGFWVCGLDETAPQQLAALDLGGRVTLVLGSEGGGLRRLVRERCDYLARLPTSPDQPTLNVSNAAAAALYELVRDKGPG